MNGRLRAAWAHADRVVAAAVAAGVVVRLVWVAVAARPPVGLRDQAFYLDAAERLLEGEGYTRYGATSAYYPPGYPAVLAAAMRAVRTVADVSGPVVAGLVNVVVAAVAIAATAVVARRLAGRSAARWTAWWCALAPGFVVPAASALTEPLYIALVALGLVALVRPDGSLRTRPLRAGEDRAGAASTPWMAWLPLAGAGVAWGAAILVRPVLVFALPVLVVASGWRRPLRSWVPALAVTAVAVAVVVPWMVRNAVVMDRFTISTNTGDNLCIGHNPDADGRFQFVEACRVVTADDGDLTPAALQRVEVARDDELTERAIDWAVSNPLRELSLVPRRVWHTFATGHEAVDAVESYGSDPWLGSGARRALRDVSDLGHLLLLVIGTYGLVRELWRADERRSGWWAVVAAIAGPLVSVVVVFGDPRFGTPVMWLLTLGAGAAIADATATRSARMGVPDAGTAPAARQPG